jgi:hypothetical protein
MKEGLPKHARMKGEQPRHAKLRTARMKEGLQRPGKHSKEQLNREQHKQGRMKEGLPKHARMKGEQPRHAKLRHVKMRGELPEAGPPGKEQWYRIPTQPSSANNT